MDDENNNSQSKDKKKYRDLLHNSFRRSLRPDDDFYKNAILLAGNAN
jgi:hypothetical protein